MILKLFGSINVAVTLAAAEGIITARNQSLLLKYGGHIELNRSWEVFAFTTNGICSKIRFYTDQGKSF